MAAVHWRLALITQATYGFVISLDASAGRLYPFVWAPAKLITPFEYTILYMVQTGIGLLIGEWLFGFLSDKFGRRRILLIAVAIAGVSFIGVAFSANFAYQLVISGISAMGVGGMLSIQVVYMQEIAPPRIRARVSQASQALGLLISGAGVGIIGSFLLPVHYQLWIFIIAGLVLLVDFPLIAFGLPESPRWLEGKGMEARALKSLAHIERAASRGGRVTLPAPDVSTHLLVETEKVPLRELLSRNFMPRNVLLVVCWTLVYSGAVYGFYQYVSLFLADKGTPISLILLITGLGSAGGSVIALLIFSWIGDRIERKTTIFIGALLYAVGVLLAASTNTAAVAELGILLTFMAMPIIFTNLYLYTANAYPTRLRSIGTGLTDGLGHNGAIWGPFVATALFGIAGASGWGWALWCAIPGALVPGVLMLIFGRKQAGVSLEALTETSK